MDRTPPRNREGSGSSFVQYRPQKSLGMLIERFLLRFEQRGKLDQLEIEIGSFA